MLPTKITISTDSWVDDLKRIWGAITSGLGNFVDNVSHVLQEVTKAAYEHAQAYDKFFLISMKLGWPPVANKLSHMTDFLAIVEEYEKNGLNSVRDRIETAMVNWHDEAYIKQMLLGWDKSPLLKPRMHILMPAVQAHMRHEYVLSVPAMLSQIEGIIADGLAFTGWMTGKQFEAQVESLLHEALIIKNKNKSIREFVTTNLMVPFFHGEPVKSPLSRHAILHGADLLYGTEPNSLKLVLFIENLRQLFRFEALENSHLFHVYGCPSLRSSKKKRRFFSNVLEATMCGLIGCKRCGAAGHFV